jgi:hypothetical protein
VLELTPIAIELLCPKLQDLVTDGPDAAHDQRAGGQLSPQRVNEVDSMELDQRAVLGSEGRKIPFDANAISLQGDDDPRQAETNENIGWVPRYK